MGVDDFRRMIVKPTDAQPKTRIVDHKILAIDETVRLHRVEKRGIVRRIPWTQMQVTQTIGPSRLLRCRSERPCDTRAHKRDKLAPRDRFLPCRDVIVPSKASTFFAVRRQSMAGS